MKVKLEKSNMLLLLDSNYLFKSIRREIEIPVKQKSKNDVKSYELSVEKQCENSSKKSNVETPPYKVLFKNGDDLRKDHVILQMITLMKKVKNFILDLKELFITIGSCLRPKTRYRLILDQT